MKTILFLMIFFSCANLKHATSVNFQDFKSFSSNASARDYWEKKVIVLNADEVKSCKFISEVFGKDNAFDQGPEFAVLYMKVNADKAKANTIIVEGNNKVGDYGNEAFGKAYQCDVK